MRNVAICFLCGTILVLVFFSFFLLRGASADMPIDKEQFLSRISGIAVSDESIYTIDRMFNSIKRYTKDGKLEYCVAYNSSGTSYIFCNDAGILCRFEEREDTVYCYDDNGRIVNTYHEDSNKLFKAGYIKYNAHINKLEKNGVTYKLNKKIILDSTVSITDAQGTTKAFPVESWISHTVINLIIIICIAAAIIGAINLMKFLIKLQNERCLNTRRRT